MQKISKSNSIIIKILLIVLFSTTIFLLCFSSILSYIVMKLDLDLQIIDFLTYFIILMTSFCVPFVSLFSVKNNGFIMGVLATIPLEIYEVINTIIFNNSYLNLLIKLTIILVFGGISGLIRVRKNRKFKVK